MKISTRILALSLAGAAALGATTSSAQAASMIPPTPSITINATRSGADVTITGTSWQSSGTLTVMVRRQGESGFTAGVAVPTLTCYTFTWNRHVRAGRTIVVYVTDGSVNSNRLRIEPQQVVSSDPIVARSVSRVRAC